MRNEIKNCVYISAGAARIAPALRANIEAMLSQLATIATAVAAIDEQTFSAQKHICCSKLEISASEKCPVKLRICVIQAFRPFAAPKRMAAL